MNTLDESLAALLAERLSQPQPRSYRQQRDHQAMRDGHAHFHPRQCRDRILAALAAAEPEWVPFDDVCDHTADGDPRKFEGMCTELVGNYLDRMERRGQIRKTPLYFNTEDRHTRPEGKNYMGFMFGYRLPSK